MQLNKTMKLTSTALPPPLEPVKFSWRRYGWQAFIASDEMMSCDCMATWQLKQNWELCYSICTPEAHGKLQTYSKSCSKSTNHWQPRWSSHWQRPKAALLLLECWESNESWNRSMMEDNWPFFSGKSDSSLVVLKFKFTYICSYEAAEAVTWWL